LIIGFYSTTSQVTIINIEKVGRLMKGKPLRAVLALLGKSWDGEELFQGAAADTRKILPGDLFFALKGEKVDGHQFLAEAFAKGAVAAVVSKDFPQSYLRTIPVDDVMAALHLLAQKTQAERLSTIVGVTGSIGKTTTKEFIAQLLTGTYKVAKTPGNANSQIGLPLTILNERDTGEVFIVEMGMTFKGHIANLVALAPPDLAIITKIGHSHVSFFSNGLEGVAEAKAEIFSHPKTKIGITNAQNKVYSSIVHTGHCRKQFFGAGGEYSLEESPEGYFIQEDGKKFGPFSLPFKASHLLENFLGAVAVARNLNVDWEDIKVRAAHLHTPALRFERTEREGIVFVNDAYNASPESMHAALSNLPMPEGDGKKIAVLGGMVDLGELSEGCHKQVAEYALGHVDHLLCYGERTLPMKEVFTQAGKPVAFFSDLTQLKETLYALAKRGDVVLIKGSNFNGLWRLLD
jgi:UDP-N-acetylmuramoyl-tripeptide--D-alanyl-D-alanine ligase